MRYVLAFGLADSIVALIVIGLYFYSDELAATISQASLRIDPSGLVSIVVPIALAAVVAVLLLGLWNASERQPDVHAVARGAAIHRALPGHGGALSVRQVLALIV
ncbi:MAG: hypothetical protein ACREDO_13000 [Methyloceanibacter sp.]